jgi:hypothetical protein
LVASAPNLDPEVKRIYLSTLDDWNQAKAAGLTASVVEIFLQRLGRWKSELAKRGIDTSFVKVVPPSAEPAKKSWWGTILKAAIVGGAIYGGYRLVTSDRPRGGEDHGDSD